MIIEIKAAFPIEWGKEYYTIDKTVKEKRAPCVCCDNTGKVTIKGVEYECPRCKGNWRNKEVVGETTVYSVGKWEVERISVTDGGKCKILTFVQNNGKEAGFKRIEAEVSETGDVTKRYYDVKIKFYAEYSEVMVEVKRLNAAEREKEEK